MGRTLFYDATLSTGSYRGMARFIRSLIVEIGKSGQFSISGLAGLKPLPGHDTIKFFSVENFFLWEQFILPLYLNKVPEKSIAIFPYNTAPLFLPRDLFSIVVIHDLIFMEPLTKVSSSRSIRQNVGRVYRRLIVPYVARRANLIVTVSEYSKAEISKKLSVSPDKIYVVPNTVGLLTSALPHNATSERYILNVGGSAPHKNTRGLMTAYSMLNEDYKNTYRLKILGISDQGSRSDLYSLMNRLGILNRVDLLDKVSDDELAFLYSGASCFVFPSLYEGFGIPLLEAMQYNVPIACSNSASIPEVAGEAALYFDPRNPSEIKNCIERILGSSLLSSSLISFGKAQLIKYGDEALRTAVVKLLKIL